MTYSYTLREIQQANEAYDHCEYQNPVHAGDRVASSNGLWWWAVYIEHDETESTLYITDRASQ
jgi:hypothetical protein